MSATHHDSSDGKDTGDDEGVYTGFNAMFADEMNSLMAAETR